MKRVAKAMIAAVMLFPASVTGADKMPMSVEAPLARLKAVIVWPTFKCAALAIGTRDKGRWLEWGIKKLECVRPYATELAQQVIDKPKLWGAMNMDGEAAGTLPVSIDATFLAGMWFQAVWDGQRRAMQPALIAAPKTSEGIQAVWMERFMSQRCDQPNFQDWLFDFGDTWEAK